MKGIHVPNSFKKEEYAAKSAVISNEKRTQGALPRKKLPAEGAFCAPAIPMNNTYRFETSGRPSCPPTIPVAQLQILLTKLMCGWGASLCKSHSDIIRSGRAVL